MEINLNQILKAHPNNELSSLKVGLILDSDRQIAEAFTGERLDKVEKTTLKSTLAYIFQLIGLTKYPENEEFFIIDDYIRTSYPNFTINELRTAFKLAVQGKLDCNIEHYEKFSPKYISQIMNAYKNRANEVRKMIKTPEESKEVPKLTDEDIVRFSKEDWLNGKRNDFNKVFNADKVFYILLKQGKLKIPPEEIIETINIVRQDNFDRLNKLYGADAKEFSKKIKNEDFIDTQCKKLTLVKYFENLSD